MTTLITVQTPACMHCNKTSLMEVPEEGYKAWSRGGVLIQDAFPTLSLEDREVLKSGIHNECWEEMFGGLEDDE